jgi:hypothetical protein
MSALAIVLIVVAVIVLVFFLGGIAGSARRARLHQAEYQRHLAEADRALEQARAADKGWDRGLMEEVARRAIAGERAGWSYDSLDLVLVDDRPGVTEDRAHFLARGADGEARVVLTRRDEGWVADRVE